MASSLTGTVFDTNFKDIAKAAKPSKLSLTRFSVSLFLLLSLQSSLLAGSCQARSLKANSSALPPAEFNQNLVHDKLIHNSNNVHAVIVECPPQINNFDVVSQGLWRGAAPSQQGMANLAQSGVKTIVDLRMAGQGAQQESQQAKQLGIKYFHIPLGFKGVSLPKMAQFLNIVDNPVNQPVFVHCRYGADRTGALVAIFRVLREHWTFAQAYSEMKSHHFKPWLAGLKRVVARVEESPKVQKELKMLTESDPKQVAAKLSNQS